VRGFFGKYFYRGGFWLVWFFGVILEGDSPHERGVDEVYFRVYEDLNSQEIVF
jgi:hypothetical protein